jgi:hypothetical protein
MELENFKVLWKSHISTEVNQQLVDKETLLKMLEEKSINTIEKIKKSILKEAFILFLSLLVYVPMAIFHPSAFGKIFLWSFTILILIFSCFLWWKYSEMNKFHTGQSDLKTVLTETIYKLEKALQLSFLVNTALMPFALPLGFYAGFTLTLPQSKIDLLWKQFSLDKVHPATWAGFAVIIFLGSFLAGIPYVKWWIKHFYGNHLQSLKERLAELQEIN